MCCPDIVWCIASHVCHCLVMDRICMMSWFQSTGNKESSINIDCTSVLSNLFDRLKPVCFICLLTYFCVCRLRQFNINNFICCYSIKFPRCGRIDSTSVLDLSGGWGLNPLVPLNPQVSIDSHNFNKKNKTYIADPPLVLPQIEYCLTSVSHQESFKSFNLPCTPSSPTRQHLIYFRL